MRLQHFGFLFVTLALTGCSSMPTFFAKTTHSEPAGAPILAPQTQIPPTFLPTQQSIDPVALSIAQSAQQIQKAVHEMKEVTIAANLPDVTPQKKAQMDALAMSVPPGLGSRVSLSYDGVFTTLVEGIAKSVGWSYMVEGNRPPVIQVLHKEYKQVRAVDAFRDISYSVQGATIVLDSINRRVIVRF